jgi:DNA repair protein RecN (Recombination protein N)
MLNELSINNFAIIDNLQVSFDHGLNIISGETGAGKSIIIGAVGLLLGDRATAEMIRTQTDAATVEALFDIKDNRALQEKLASMEFNSGDELVIRRVISRSGKNRATINGQMATLANLVAISESLINICGQHEHQVILHAENHIDILDEFGGCIQARSFYEGVYRRHQQIRVQIGEMENLRRNREERTELIKFQLQEIEDINPRAGEDVMLADEKKVLVNIQKLTDCAARAYDLLYGETNSITEKIKEVQSRIKEIRKIDAGLPLSDSDIDGSFIALEEAALGLRNYGKNLFFDPERLAAIDERSEMLNRLKRKYGGALELVLSRRREMEDELQRVFSVEAELEKLKSDEITVQSELQEKACELTRLRKTAARKLKERVDEEIHALNMPHAHFFADFREDDPARNESDITFGPKGADEVEFYLAANKGEEPKPLNRIASGGELSRIILALKNVLSQNGSVATVVFDEVDSGIGGATAEIVGRKLKEAAVNHQVICITHLPQIACFGGSHLLVQKKITGGRTTATVEKLSEEQKVEEISRMLGGVDLTAKTREHAREMLCGAGAGKIRAGGRETKNDKKSIHQ